MFLAVGGGSVGFQIGGSFTDVVMLFMNDRALQSLLSDKFKIGADATVAAGPVGRNAATGTDVKLNAEIMSYSRSKGLLPGSAWVARSCRPTRAETTPCTAPASPAGKSWTVKLRFLSLRGACSTNLPSTPPTVENRSQHRKRPLLPGRQTGPHVPSGTDMEVTGLGQPLCLSRNGIHYTSRGRLHGASNTSTLESMSANDGQRSRSG